MKNFTDYLNSLQTAQNIPSDYALAKYLGVTKQTVSAYRNRGVTVSIETAWRIADGLGVDPSEVLAAAEITRAERAHDSTRAALWSQRLRQLTAAVCVVFLGFFHVSDASAETPAADEVATVYIMLNRIAAALVRLRQRFDTFRAAFHVGQFRPVF